METKSKDINESNINTTTFSSSLANNMNQQTIAQYNVDARLMVEFEESGMKGKFFNYSKSVLHAPPTATSVEQITAYLSKIQRGGLIQPFGCIIVIEDPSFRILGYSENLFDMMGLENMIAELHQLDCVLGMDARSLFASSSRDSLDRAVATRKISLLNPIGVHSRSNQKPFYAILHRIDVGIVIDLEPAHSSDPQSLVAGAVQSHKLAIRAISRLQSLPEGDVDALCNMVVEDMQQLTGYDRVMVYKFHDDNHGEVVSEIRRSDLEPYLGLHYPATDIPQAARFLFKQNRVRIISDCHAQPVKIIQSKELKQPLVLVNSTLRAPHSCHTQYMLNMNSIASLVMSVVINNRGIGESKKLWGLVVCHHTSSRYIPFPLRYACEFLVQAFSLQLYMELQLATQLAEKKILQMQTLLCDMLLRDVPLGIVTQSPSIMDLIKCDGAALYYGGKTWLLGVTPTESQLKDIADWLLISHGDSTGFSTDNLGEAGYPGAASLGDAVCGMAVARISSKDFLFWFRSHAANELKWGGAKHHPLEKDDGERMHPRSSFKAFLEVTKSRSLPWEASEINAIHSLQLIMRDSLPVLQDCSITRLMDSQRTGFDGSSANDVCSAALEMVRLIETAIAPIFAVDASGLINGWNAKMSELTGMQDSEAVGKSLIDDVVHKDARRGVQSILDKALNGEEGRNVEIKLQNIGEGPSSSMIYLRVNACTSRDSKNNVVGVCFVGQDITAEKGFRDKFVRLEGDYKTIVQSVNPMIPPIFASDANACCSEWNAAMERLTGWKKYEVVGKILPGEIFGDLCPIEGQDPLTKFMILLYQAMSGHATQQMPFGFHDRRGKFMEVLISANKRTDHDGNTIGCVCFLKTKVTVALESSSAEKEVDGEGLFNLEKLKYIRQELKNALDGIRFTHNLLEETLISEGQKHLLDIAYACERQIRTIKELDLRGIEEGQLEMDVEDFNLGKLIDTVVSQVMILLRDKNLHLVYDVSDQMKALPLYGDRMKIQLLLSDFLHVVANYAPSPNGLVEINVSLMSQLMKDGNEFLQLRFRMTHQGPGLPQSLTKEMSGELNQGLTEEGFGLNVSRKLLSMLNGAVQYIRELESCSFLIDLELGTRNTDVSSSSPGTGKD